MTIHEIDNGIPSGDITMVVLTGLGQSWGTLIPYLDLPLQSQIGDYLAKFGIRVVFICPTSRNWRLMDKGPLTKQGERVHAILVREGALCRRLYVAGLSDGGTMALELLHRCLRLDGAVIHSSMHISPASRGMGLPFTPAGTKRRILFVATEGDRTPVEDLTVEEYNLHAAAGWGCSMLRQGLDLESTQWLARKLRHWWAHEINPDIHQWLMTEDAPADGGSFVYG